MLDWQQLPELELLLDLLLEDLARLEGSRVLVVDEWQLIAQAGLESWLPQLLAGLPRQFHLFLGSRSRPEHLPLARLKAARELVEIDSHALSFTADELSALLGPQATADGPCLMRQTQGWPLGVQLLRLGCEQATLAEGVAAENDLSAYLLDDILLQLPAELQSFLRLTASLPRFHSDLAAELCTDGASLLQEVRRRNLFVQTSDGEWFTYRPSRSTPRENS